MKISFLFLFFCYFTLQSQDIHKHTAENYFLIGQSYLVYNNEANLYKKAKSQSKVLQVLNAGDFLKLLEKITVVLEEGEIKSEYFKVETIDAVVGYITSTKLALGFFTANNNSIILYQIQRHTEDTLLHFKSITKAGEAIDLGPFDLHYPDFNITFNNNLELPRIDHVMTLDFMTDACDMPRFTRYLSLNLAKNELLYFALLENTCPSKDVETLQKLIFPAQDNGIKDRVVYYSMKKELVGEKFQEYKTYIYTRQHKWVSGTLLRPIFTYEW